MRDAYYFDTSALAKRYLMEPGSRRVLQLMDPATGHHLWIGRLAHVELVAAVTRRVKMGQLAANDADMILTLFDHERTMVYRTVEVPIPVLDRAMTLARQLQLRGYDAVQLACAQELAKVLATAGASLTVVCADGELSAAARRSGLAVDIPSERT